MARVFLLSCAVIFLVSIVSINAQQEIPDWPWDDSRLPPEEIMKLKDDSSWPWDDSRLPREEIMKLRQILQKNYRGDIPSEELPPLPSEEEDAPVVAYVAPDSFRKVTYGIPENDLPDDGLGAGGDRDTGRPEEGISW